MIEEEGFYLLKWLCMNEFYNLGGLNLRSDYREEKKRERKGEDEEGTG